MRGCHQAGKKRGRLGFGKQKSYFGPARFPAPSLVPAAKPELKAAPAASRIAPTLAVAQLFFYTGLSILTLPRRCRAR